MESEKPATPLSLQEIAQIALGDSSMKQTNIAVLYSLIQTILKKLNCENEVVTIRGAKSKELKELLSKANYCPMPCDEKVEILTKKLDNLPAMEKKIEQMEAKLEKHLIKAKKYADLVNAESTKTTSDTATPPAPHINAIQWKEPSTLTFNENLLAELVETEVFRRMKAEYKCAQNVHKLRKHKSRCNVHGFPHCGETSGSEETQSAASFSSSKTTVYSYESSELSETFSQFKNRIENMDGDWRPVASDVCGAIKSSFHSLNSVETQRGSEEIEPIAEIETASESKEADENQSSDGGSLCFKPCENLLTIPDPEHELPRFLLASDLFTGGLKRFPLRPFKRLVNRLQYRIEDLRHNFADCLYKWEALLKRSACIDAIFQDIENLQFDISNYETILKESLHNMQQIFDLKFDKIDVRPLKAEIKATFAALEASIHETKIQLHAQRATIFMWEPKDTIPTNTAIGKSSSKASSKTASLINETPCNCDDCSGDTGQVLMHRIQRLNYEQMNSMRNRISMRQKVIRLTNSSFILDPVSTLSSCVKAVR